MSQGCITPVCWGVVLPEVFLELKLSPILVGELGRWLALKPRAETELSLFLRLLLSFFGYNWTGGYSFKSQGSKCIDVGRVNKSKYFLPLYLCISCQEAKLLTFFLGREGWKRSEGMFPSD